jgi:amidohydrolase
VRIQNPDHLDDQVRTWRRDLHRVPETAFEEHETSDYVAAVLTQLGFDVVRGIGTTGVVGSLSRGGSGRVVGLRADMDALPIEEVEGRPLRSTHPGRMHACGHDAHMAMVLGAAAVLAADEGVDGTVRVVFQPAEEPGRGAQAMIDDGLFDRFPMDALYGLHNLPGLPAGHLQTRPGAILASEDDFEIVVTGRAGHASAPHLVIDPLVVGAEIVLALQTVVARSIDPLQPAVLSCTELHTDGARNAIPGLVRISGDTRSFVPEVQARLEHRIREVVQGIAAAHGAAATVTYRHEFTPTVNDPAPTRTAVMAATRTLGADRVTADGPPIMASEDFGVFARHVPACFLLLGGGSDAAPLHSREYAVNEDVLLSGVDVLVAVARAELEP